MKQLILFTLIKWGGKECDFIITNQIKKNNYQRKSYFLKKNTVK